MHPAGQIRRRRHPRRFRPGRVGAVRIAPEPDEMHLMIFGMVKQILPRRFGEIVDALADVLGPDVQHDQRVGAEVQLRAQLFAAGDMVQRPEPVLQQPLPPHHAL